MKRAMLQLEHGLSSAALSELDSPWLLGGFGDSGCTVLRDDFLLSSWECVMGAQTSLLIRAPTLQALIERT